MKNIYSHKLYKYIGKNIRELRKLKGITSKNLAERTNIADGTIRNIESGASASLPTLLSISNELDVSFDSLIHNYTVHKQTNKVNTCDLEIFIDTYLSCSDSQRSFLMDYLNFFRDVCSKDNKDDD